MQNALTIWKPCIYVGRKLTSNLYPSLPSSRADRIALGNLCRKINQELPRPHMSDRILHRRQKMVHCHMYTFYTFTYWNIRSHPSNVWFLWVDVFLFWLSRRHLNWYLLLPYNIFSLSSRLSSVLTFHVATTRIRCYAFHHHDKACLR